MAITAWRLATKPDEDANVRVHLTFLRKIVADPEIPQALPALRDLLTEIGVDPRLALEGHTFTQVGMELLMLRLASW